MTERPGDNPPPGDGLPDKPAARPDRQAREAKALRANLLKRKDQARQREAERRKPEE